GRKGVVLQKRPEHWGEVSRYVESLVRAGTLKTFSVPAGRVICFSAGRLHRGARMNLPEGQVHSRFFFRASLFPEDHPASAGPTEGKVRHHQQVYRIFPQDTFLPFVEAEGMAPEIISSEIIKGAIRKYSPQDLELEPRLNGCDLDFALQRGGSLTKELLTQILPTFSNIRRDTARVHTSTHMLSRGWLPGKLPGWNQMEEYEGSGLSGEQLVLTVNGREVQYRNSVGQVVDLPHGELLRCSLNEPLLFRPSLHTPGFEWSFRLRISCLGESERGWPTLPDNFCGKQHLVCIPEGGWW
ncbi:MAG: hypothetical protein KDD70_12030, partial [Bdellovibrionales bacterium]|nr:hypothetical protein [Bdellovibrionales bacterium]